jgi:hypothetical protein
MISFQIISIQQIEEHLIWHLGHLYSTKNKDSNTDLWGTTEIWLNNSDLKPLSKKSVT